MDFADSVSDLYSAPVTAMMYAICSYIGPRYNDTQLQIFSTIGGEITVSQ